MKRFSFLLATSLWSAATLSSCNKEQVIIDPVFSTDSVAMREGAATMKAFFDKHRPQNERFSIDAAAGGTLTTSNGTRITIAPNALRLNGNPVSGTVNIWVRDILRPDQMLLADKPSVATSGRMLECYGQIMVQAEQGGQELQLPPNAAMTRSMNVAMPIGTGSSGTQKNIPLWSGDTSVTITAQGYNHENAPTTVSAQYTFKKGMEWREMPGFAIANDSANYFNLDSLGAWRNVDALYNETTPRTTVLCFLGDKYNPLSGNVTAQDPSMVFFKAKNTNLLVKLYTTILNPAAGREGFLSYQNSMPVGQEGTFLVISSLGNKLYAEMRDVTIPSPAAGKTYVGYDFNLTEVSEGQLQNLIQQLNSK